MTKIKTKSRNNCTRKKRKVFNLVVLNYFIFFLVLGSCVYYIVGVNDLSVKGFQLFELKSKLDNLEAEYNSFELHMMGLESFAKISQRAGGMGFVKADNVDYLTGVRDVVAKIDQD